MVWRRFWKPHNVNVHHSRTMLFHGSRLFMPVIIEEMNNLGICNIPPTSHKAFLTTPIVTSFDHRPLDLIHCPGKQPLQ
jgi:hypothetical protein